MTIEPMDGDVTTPCLESDNSTSRSKSPDSHVDVEDKTVFFDPPLYKQRYLSVNKYIDAFHKVSPIDKLLDVGCADCKYMWFARMNRSLTRMYGLDIDKELLLRKAKCLKPRFCEWLNKRRFDMSVKVFAGSIVDRDPITLGTDVVTAIEVIEHLDEPVLEAFILTVFDYIRPKLVIITTPNSEYNVLFPNFSGMRHWDHKFEWTREQFQQWCERVGSTYCYDVRYEGIGDPPPESVSLGCCSQVAIFTLKDDKLHEQTTSTTECATTYEEVYSTVYPGWNLTDEEILDNDISYAVSSMSFQYTKENYVKDLSKTHVPLDYVLSCYELVKLQCDVDKLTERLQKLNYTLSDDKKCVVVDREEPQSDEESFQEDESTVCWEETPDEELWD